MEYRLNVLGGLRWFGHKEKIDKWTLYKIKYAMDNWMNFKSYSEEDVKWWLNQLNNQGE